VAESWFCFELAGFSGRCPMKRLLMRVFMRLGYVFYRLYFWLLRPITLGAAAVILDSQGRVLLVRHTYQDGWHLPGGGVKKGESLFGALRRELSEETGIGCSYDNSTLVGLFYQRIGFKHNHLALFLVKCGRAPESFPANWEIEEATFFEPDALPLEINAGTRAKIKQALALAANPDISPSFC